jgi:hypothetical protein
MSRFPSATDNCPCSSALHLTIDEALLARSASTIEKDAVYGPFPTEILARVSAQTGDSDRAISAVEGLLSIPYAGNVSSNVPLTPALLRLDPMFDPLRNDPRFQKLAASPAPR